MSRPNRKVNTMQDLQIIMQGMFSRINEHFFNNELEKVIITFESGFKKGAYGWITLLFSIVVLYSLPEAFVIGFL